MPVKAWVQCLSCPRSAASRSLVDASCVFTVSMNALNQMFDTPVVVECIVLLGFAYHTQNVRLLKPAKPIERKDVFGTAYQMSDSDADVVSHQIADFFEGG